jgi:hypothetical protein
MEASQDVLGSTKGWLGRVEVGEGRHFRNLTVFPLTVGEEADGPPRYELLSDAIAAGRASVGEVSEGGEVPFLTVSNVGTIPILIPEGEILIGAKQNRTVNLTMLVAAGATFKLPVSCVESGRWGYASRHFRPAAWAHPKLRSLKVKTAQESRAMGLDARSDQGAVWDEVEEHLHALDAGASPTRSWTDGYEAAEGRLEDYRESIELPANACGLLAAHEGKVVGLDLFDRPETLRKLWDRLGDAYFIEAVRDVRPTEATRREAAEAFLGRVVDRLAPAPEQPDLGFELELAGDDLGGTALWHDGAVCHLAAFSVRTAD